MNDLISDQFQNKVDEVLIRHVSILDILTKLQQSSSQTNRAVVKSITSCGCISVNAKKNDLPENIDYENISEYKKTHIEGDLCPVCKEKIEQEIGNNLFYLSALCNHLDLNLYDVLLKEYDQIKTLGKFSLY